MKRAPFALGFPCRSKGGDAAADTILWIVCWVIAGLVWGCTNSKTDMSSEYLVRVNDRTVTVEDFNTALKEMNHETQAMAPKRLEGQPEIRRYLLNQLVEKSILMERAEELGLQVSKAELAQAETGIREDYPEDAFEQVLLEQDVAYTQWKLRLRERLLLEKVVALELEPKVTLTPADISAYYEKHHALLEDENNDAPGDAAFSEALLQLVRNQKKEEAYRTWIEELQNRYTIDVNAEAWERINAAGF